MNIDLEKLDKGARPIFDEEIYNFVKSNASDCWNEPTNIMTFTDKEAFKTLYKAHISAYKHTQLVGLDKYTNSYVVDGVTGAFMDWYSIYGIDNIYVLKGEYPFHQRNGCTQVNSVYNVPENKVLILSLPFSATGNVHNDYNKIMQVCELKNITVLLDCAYLNISALGDIDINYECVQAVSTSLSKVYATGMNKIGLLFYKNSIQSPVVQLDEWHYLNHHSMVMHSELLKAFNVNYVFDKYVSRHSEVCTQLGLQKSNTLLFGVSNDAKWSNYSRGGVINRVCISKILQY